MLLHWVRFLYGSANNLMFMLGPVPSLGYKSVICKPAILIPALATYQRCEENKWVETPSWKIIESAECQLMSSICTWFPVIIPITNSSTELSFLASVSAIHPHISSIIWCIQGPISIGNSFYMGFNRTLNWKNNWSGDPITFKETNSKSGQESDEVLWCLWIRPKICHGQIRASSFISLPCNIWKQFSWILQPML